MANVALSVVTDASGTIKGLKLIGDGIDQVEAKTKKMSSVVQGMYQGFGQAIGSRILNETLGVVNLLGAAFERAGEKSKLLTQLSTSSRMTTTELQRMAALYGLVGKSVEDVARSSNFLKKQLGTGNIEAVAAVKALGLSFDALRAKSPDEQMQAVVRAIGAIHDPTTRAAIATKLLSEEGAGLGGVAGKYDEVADRAERMGKILSATQVAGLNDAKKGWENVTGAASRFWDQVVGGLASSESLHVLLKLANEQLGEMARWAKENQQALLEFTSNGVLVALDGVNLLIESFRKLKDAQTGFKIGTNWIGDQLAKQNYTNDQHRLLESGSISRSEYDSRVASYSTTIDKLGSADTSRLMKENRESQQAINDLQKKLGDLRKQVADVAKDAHKPAANTDRPGTGPAYGARDDARLEAEAQAALDQIRRDALHRQLTGPGFYTSLDTLAKPGAGDGLYGSAKDEADQLELMGKQEELRKSEAAANERLAAAMPGVNAAIEKRTQHQVKMRDAIRETKVVTVDWTESLQSLSQMLSATGQAGGKLGSMLGGLSGIGATLQGFQAKDANGNLLGGLSGGFKNLMGSFKGGGLSGILSGISGVGALASSAFGIGKALFALFKSDPVKKAQKEISAALGHSVTRDMAQSMMDEAKATGKSLAQVGKEMEYRQAQEKRQTMLEGLGTAQGGVEELLKYVPWANADVAAGAGKMFGSVFWKTWQEQGLEGLAKMRPLWDKMAADMTAAGVDPTSMGLGSMSALMTATENERFKAAAGMSGGAQQILQGATAGGFVDKQMLEGSLAIGKEQLAASRDAHLSDKDTFLGMTGLMQAQLNAATASGEKIPADLQALLDEAKANGVSILADPTIRTAVATEGILRLMGGVQGSLAGGGASAGDGVTYNPDTGGTSGWGPRPSGYPTNLPWPPTEMSTQAGGGAVTPARGGRAFIRGEGGQTEYVIPASKMPRDGGGGAPSVQQTNHFYIDPLQVTEGREQLGGFLIDRSVRAFNSSPIVRQALRKSGTGWRQ